MEESLDEKEVLKNAVDAVEQRSIEFEIDVPGLFGKKKKKFEVRPLTVSQVHRISKLIIDIDGKLETANDLFLMLRDHARKCTEIVAIAVTDSRKEPSKKLVDLFFNNLDHRDMDTALQIVLKQMEVISFINTIASIKSLSVLERKPAGAKNAKKNEVRPTVPGTSLETV